MSRFLTLCAHAERWLLLWLYAFIVVVIFSEVVRRFVFDYSSQWGEEAARYAFIYLVWIGAAVGIRNRTHIRIDILFGLLPARGVAVLYAAGDLATIVFACFALYWSIEPVLQSIRFDSVTPGLRVTQAWFLFSVPFGFTLVLLRSAAALWQDFGDIRAGRDPYAGQKLFE